MTYCGGFGAPDAPKGGGTHFMSGIAWVFIGVLGICVTLLRVGARSLRRELDAARRDMYRGQYDAEEKLHRLDREITLLKLEARTREGTLRVGPHATVADTLALHPQMSQVLGRYHIGLGQGGLTESLADAAAAYSQDLEVVLTAVHEALEHPETLARGPQITRPAEDAFQA